LNYTRIFVTGDGGKTGTKVKALSAQFHFHGCCGIAGFFAGFVDA